MGIIVEQERVFQKVILYPVLQVLVIMMPAHASFEGVTVVMDSLKVIVGSFFRYIHVHLIST